MQHCQGVDSFICLIGRCPLCVEMASRILFSQHAAKVWYSILKIRTPSEYDDNDEESKEIYGESVHPIVCIFTFYF